MRNLTLLVVATFALAGCTDKKTADTPSADTRGQATELQARNLDVIHSEDFAQKHTTFDAYWFRGLAELSRYELKQSRYGEIHDGETVLVFVTEPFKTDAQVKYEGGDKKNVEQVLKLNHYSRFYTGIYPYNLTTSVFTPAKRDGPTIKLAHSVQEWCGHVFAQANLKSDATGYDVQSFSYFMNEGDKRFALDTAMLEDGLWTTLRRGPDKLPTGEVTLLPSATFLRLMHKPWTPVAANAALGPEEKTEYSERPVRRYEVSYPSFDRTLTIWFEASHPYRIVRWTDSYPALFNRDGGSPERLTTEATLTNSIMLDYWSKNAAADGAWRDALGLEY